MAMEPELLEALRRDSGLRLDDQGTFYFRSRLVENERVQALFHRHLSVLANGDVTLSVGVQWAYVACDSVARFIDGMKLEGGQLWLRYRHLEHPVASAPLIGFGPDGRCYVWAVRKGPPAVLTRTAHQALVSLLEEHAEEVVLPVGAQRHPVAELTEVPTPAALWPC